jgi:DNA-binding transcriptional MerR regulator
MKYDFSDLLSSSQAANAVGVSVKTIREWDEKGIFVPIIRDKRFGRSTRYYTKKQCKERKKEWLDKLVKK